MKLRIWRRSFAQRGFTLVEIILVTVIIMILVGIVGPRLVGKAKTAKINATKIAMHGVKSALQDFELHASRFPSTAEGLQALFVKPADLSQDEWTGPYMDGKTQPKDAFQTEYKYTCPSENGNDYDLLSAGPDKKFGTDDDISLFEEEKANNL